MKVDFIRYVVGLAFHGVPPVIMLQRKVRPGWQHDKINCPGGKCEEGETGATAMSREFEEETGLRIAASAWQEFFIDIARTEPKDAAPGWMPHTIQYFRFQYKTDTTPLPTRQTDEPVGWESVRQTLSDRFQASQLIGNLNWLIPMALDWREQKGSMLVWDDIRRKPNW